MRGRRRRDCWRCGRIARCCGACPSLRRGGGWIAVGRGVAEESGDDLTVAIAPLDRVPDDPAIETLCSLPDGRAVLAVDGELADAPENAGPADERPVLRLGRFPAPLTI